MGLFLFIIVLVVSFIAVRIGAIAFQLTGLNWELAKFQALSCFTGTGFTTRESELIVGHGQRRKIASVLMVLGNAGLVLMIASFATSLNPLIMDTIDEPLLP
ncbi:MAG: TrkA C-terminal domain-containing protein, partial [Planctomycetota bacterium]